MFFTSVEFYVIATIVAAAVIAYSAMPARCGAVRQYLLAGDLDATSAPQAPGIEVLCHDDGTVTLTRHGLAAWLQADGACSLACTLNGATLEIQERLTAGRGREADAPRPDTARFDIHFLARGERYHVMYNSEATGTMTAFTLANKPGLRISRALNL